jgi:hypothetical protein
MDLRKLTEVKYVSLTLQDGERTGWMRAAALDFRLRSGVAELTLQIDLDDLYASTPEWECPYCGSQNSSQVCTGCGHSMPEGDSDLVLLYSGQLGKRYFHDGGVSLRTTAFSVWSGRD